jgi:hypothetical protein
MKVLLRKFAGYIAQRLSHERRRLDRRRPGLEGWRDDALGSSHGDGLAKRRADRGERNGTRKERLRL